MHVNETTISFPFDSSKAEEVTSAFIELLQTFKDKQAAERPKRWKPMDYKYRGTTSSWDSNPSYVLTSHFISIPADRLIHVSLSPFSLHHQTCRGAWAATPAARTSLLLNIERTPCKMRH